MVFINLRIYKSDSVLILNYKIEFLSEQSPMQTSQKLSVQMNVAIVQFSTEVTRK